MMNLGIGLNLTDPGKMSVSTVLGGPSGEGAAVSPYPTLTDPSKQLALIDFDRQSYSDEGVTPAVAGDPIKLVKLVSGWDLLSVGGYVRQDTLALRPTLRADGSQGNGSTSTMSMPATISLTGDFTIYDVSSRTTSTHLMVLLGGSVADRIVMWTDGNVYAQPGGGTVATFTDGQTGMQIRRISRSGSSLKYKRNGAAEQSGTSAQTYSYNVFGQFVSAFFDNTNCRRRQQWIINSYIAEGSADDLAIIAAIQALYPGVSGP